VTPLARQEKIVEGDSSGSPVTNASCIPRADCYVLKTQIYQQKKECVASIKVGIFFATS